MVLLNLILEFLSVVSFIFFFLLCYDAYRWESNKFKRFDKMLHNDILGYMADLSTLDYKMWLLEALCEDELDEPKEIILAYENPWKKVKYNETSLQNQLYFDELWYHLRVDDHVQYAVPFFKFKERSFFAKKQYKIMNPKWGLIHNYEILWDKTTSRRLFSKRASFRTNVNTKYQATQIHSFEKYHSNFEFYRSIKYIGIIGAPFFYQNALHYMIPLFKGGEPYGYEEMEQIMSVNYCLHTTRGKIELGADVEVKKKPKNFTGRMPTDYEKCPRFKPKVVYISPKEFLKPYWDCPEKAPGLFRRLIEHYYKYVKPLEDQAALIKAHEAAIALEEKRLLKEARKFY
jgi:hypothetical protein